MTARDYEHDEWIPWYVEDTPGWLELSLGARGAMAEIARKLNRGGELRLRRGLSSLAVLLRLRWEGELEGAVAELIAAGKVRWDGSTFTLSDPEYLARKRRSSADRMRDHRARSKRDASDGGDVTSVTSERGARVTRVTPVLVSSDLISSGSDLETQTRATTVPDTGPPDWWEPTLASIEMTTGESLPSGEAWLRYSGHRASKEPPKPVSKPDAQYWLTSVMIPERRKARDDAHHRDKRDAHFDAKRKFSKDGPEKPPSLTKAQEQAFADQLAARVQAARAGGGR